MEYGVKYEDLEFVVIGNYVKEDPQGYEFQGDPEELEVEQILLEGNDITDIISDYVVKVLKEKIIEENHR